MELDIRTLKISLNMDVLRCKTPEMVRKEIWTCLLAYNLIRQRILQAALVAKRSPRQISFTAAMQKIAASWQAILMCVEPIAQKLIEVHLQDIGASQIGDRPDRVEPRAVKRRPKPHPLLTKPRREAKTTPTSAAA
jgi:hypothetical protein